MKIAVISFKFHWSPIDIQGTTSSDNGLLPISKQGITSTCDGLIYWCILYRSMRGLGELMYYNYDLDIIAVIFLWSTRTNEIHTRVHPLGRGKSTGCHWWRKWRNTHFLQKIWHLVWHMSTGLRVLAYHPHRFGTFLKPSPWLPRGVRMASWLPHGFCIASAWLPNDPDDSRQLPDQLHVGSWLAPNVFGSGRVLSGRFPKHSRSCPQRGSLQDIVCGRCGSTEDRRDVLTMSAGQCRQSAEGVPKFISASKFCSGPKSRRGKFSLSRRRRNVRKRSGAIKTVKGIFQEYADRLPNHADW